MGRSRSISLILAVLFIVGGSPLVVVSITTAQGTPGASPTAGSSTFAAAACPYELPPNLVDGENVACGYLEVPEEYVDPEGATLRLPVAVLASSAEEPASAPLVVLTGGPGQGASAILPLFAEESPATLLPLLERQDVILFDQRGTGFAEPALTCPLDLTEAATPEATPGPETDPLAIYTECADQLRAEGVNLEAFTTAASAADVDALRRALGYEQVDLYGISYGTRLALTVMRDFPDTVRSAALASPLPLEVDLFAGQVIAFDQALRLALEGCAADLDCDATNPGLADSFAQAVVRLGAAPLLVPVEDPVSGETVEVPVDDSLFLQAVYVAVFAGQASTVPPLISSVAAGDPTVLAEVLPVVLQFGVGISTGLLFAVNCQDEAPFSSPEQVRQQVAEADVRPELQSGAFLGVQGLGAFEICEAWGLEPSGPEASEPVTSDIPTLIIAGEFDPITPPAYGARIEENLSAGTLVVLPGLGHDPVSFGGPCALTIVLEFLSEPTSEPDTACTVQLEADFSPEEEAASPEASPAAMR